MAKLNVVVPAVNVIVESVEYRLVDRKAVTGDIVRITDEDAKGSDYLTFGAFYKVDRIDACNDPQIADDDGDEHDLCGWAYEVYEKVVAPKHEFKPGDKVRGKITGTIYTLKERAPEKDGQGNGKAWRYTGNNGWVGEDQFELVEAAAPVPSKTEDDVIVHEGRRYRKVARKADVGELVVIVDAHPYGGKYVNGDILTVRKPFIGDWVYLGDIDYATKPAEYNVLEPLEITPQYREVKRQAKVGERIRIVNPQTSFGHYDVGTELTVKRIDSDGDVWFDKPKGGGEFIAHPREFVVLEPLESISLAPQYREVKRKANVGERIRIVSTWLSAGRYKTGDEFTATEVNHDGGVTVTLPNGVTPYISYRHEEYVVLEPVTTSAAEPPRSLDPRSKFAVGDKVRLVAGGSEHPLFKDGNVYEVSDPLTTSHSGKRVQVRKEDSVRGYALPDQLVKVTAEEIAEGERKAAEEAKWSAIGRKVGEYKAGDVVEATRTLGEQERVTGTVEDARSDRDSDKLGLRMADGRYRAVLREGAKLVVPVEQRFDTPATA